MVALAAISVTGVVIYVFGAVGSRLKDIVDTWLAVPINTGL
jgi:hypothetical protein